jgi:uncharacterized protein
MDNETTIWSEGTRLAANLWLPGGANHSTHPALLLCHGWGGPKSHLNNTYAPLFRDAGFVVLTFDYRGWHESEGRIVPVGDLPESGTGGEKQATVREVRDVVDPFDQLVDIQNCLDFLAAQPRVDADRIGIWGSSYGGGHVVMLAALDARVSAVVAQVGAYAGSVDRNPELGRQRGAEKARGEHRAGPPTEDQVEGLAGTPDQAKMVRYVPISLADRIRVPTLVIDAEQEELFSPAENGRRLYDIVREHAPAEYKVYPCTHYQIYNEFFPRASKLALEWYLKHLQP